MTRAIPDFCATLHAQAHYNSSLANTPVVDEFWAAAAVEPNKEQRRASCDAVIVMSTREVEQGADAGM